MLYVSRHGVGEYKLPRLLCCNACGAPSGQIRSARCRRRREDKHPLARVEPAAGSISKQYILWYRRTLAANAFGYAKGCRTCGSCITASSHSCSQSDRRSLGLSGGNVWGCQLGPVHIAICPDSIATVLQQQGCRLLVATLTDSRTAPP